MDYRERLREWITDHDLKQKALAKELGITKAVISNYLTGRSHMPIEVLVRLSQILGLSMDYLVGLTDEPLPAMQLTASERQFVEKLRTLSYDQKELIAKTIALMQEQNQRRQS